MDNIPSKCYECKYCVERDTTTYMPYKECRLAGLMIYFSNINGYDRMIWCPLVKGDKK